MVLRIVLVALLGLGVIGMAVAGLSLLPGGPPPAATATPEPPARMTILVAAGPLRGGSLIKPQDLRGQELLRSEAPAGAVIDGPQQRGNLTGAMVRHTMGEGQPILPDDIVRPGDHGFLAAVLQPGMRAVTVAVDAVSGTAGLIWPGDRVDVVMTQALDDPALSSGHRIAAQTILSGARVIAIDQQLVQGQPAEGTAAPPTNRTATLEVTPAQVERVLVAGKLGHLSLSVLSADHATSSDAQVAAGSPASATAGAAGATPAAAAARNPAPGSGVTWGSDVSPALSNADAHAPPMLMHVFEGQADPKDFHF